MPKLIKDGPQSGGVVQQPAQPVMAQVVPGPIPGTTPTARTPRKAARGLPDPERRQLVAMMLLERYTADEIALSLGVTPEQLDAELEGVRQEWQARRLVLTAERIAEELGHLEHIRSEAYLAWERSKAPSVRSTRTIKHPSVVGIVKRDGEVVTAAELGVMPERTVTRVTEGRDGNPAFLQAAMSASNEIRKLLGLDAPEVKRLQVQNTHGSGAYSYDELLQMDPAQLGDLYSAALEAAATPQ